MSSGDPKICLIGFSLASIKRRVHSMRRGPKISWPRYSAASRFEPIANLLRHRTQPEAGNLGKDEPHPMAPFSAGGQFFYNLRIDVGLSVDKSLEGIRVDVRPRRHRTRFHALISGPLGP